MTDDQKKNPYTCNDYRQEMVLVGLKMRLQQAELDEKEKFSLLQEIEKLEKEMGL